MVGLPGLGAAAESGFAGFVVDPEGDAGDDGAGREVDEGPGLAVGLGRVAEFEGPLEIGDAGGGIDAAIETGLRKGKALDARGDLVAAEGGIEPVVVEERAAAQALDAGRADGVVGGADDAVVGVLGVFAAGVAAEDAEVGQGGEVDGFAGAVASAQEDVAVADGADEADGGDADGGVGIVGEFGVAEDDGAGDFEDEEEGEGGEGGSPQGGDCWGVGKEPHAAEARPGGGGAEEGEQGGEGDQAEAEVDDGHGGEGRHDGELKRIEGRDADGEAVEEGGPAMEAGEIGVSASPSRGEERQGVGGGHEGYEQDVEPGRERVEKHFGA